MPFYSTSKLPPFITLPADDAVEVRYDAFSGAQPGEMRQFAVGTWDTVSGDQPVGHNSPPWNAATSATNAEIITYGADLFARTYEYSNYGRLVNPDTTGYTGYSAHKDHKVTVKVQVKDGTAPTPAPAEDLLLTYEQTGDSITYIQYTPGVNEVKRVTFNTKTVDYTYQQIVTLTLTNQGNTEIRGIHIDVPTLNAAFGPYFYIVSAPAVNLPAGASTTFQISYIPNLPVGTYENIDTTLPVNILYDNGGSKTFEAVLKVSDKKLHTVTVVVRPDEPGEGRIMGDGRLVEGVSVSGGADQYDGNGATSTYEAYDPSSPSGGSLFWVITEPRDEYKLLEIGGQVQVYYYVDDNPANAKVYLREYPTNRPSAVIALGTTTTGYQSTAANERLFWGYMPDYSITVYVDYYEPLTSKLRLSDLHAFAWASESEAVWNAAATPPTWDDPGPHAFEHPLRDTQANGYNVILFDPAKDTYTVILDPKGSPIEDDFCGVTVTLRELETHNNFEGSNKNQDIAPTIEMTLDDGDELDVGAFDPVGNTFGPTTHRSKVFGAPEPDPTQNTLPTKTMTIRIFYDSSVFPLNPDEGEQERIYKVRFVRAGKLTDEAKHQLNAGNSPFGMIENESTFSAATKQAAKDDFIVENRFRDPALTPEAAKSSASTIELSHIYWPETWGWTLGNSASTGDSMGVPTYEIAANASKPNFDRDEGALFVYLGKPFYDPGVEKIYNNSADLIDGIPVKRTLSRYYQMDTSATDAMTRFTGGTAVTSSSIDLGTVQAVNGAIPGETITVGAATYDGMVNQFASVKDVRPGIYQLTYTFDDYNGTDQIFFTRPLIVLAQLGDVNADRFLITGVRDANAIRKRFSSALPGVTQFADATLGTDGVADSLLYRYRIVDANNDRNINNIDADLIRWVTTSGFTGRTALTEFYKPVQYTNPVKP